MSKHLFVVQLAKCLIQGFHFKYFYFVSIFPSSSFRKFTYISTKLMARLYHILPQACHLNGLNLQQIKCHDWSSIQIMISCLSGRLLSDWKSCSWKRNFVHLVCKVTQRFVCLKTFQLKLDKKDWKGKRKCFLDSSLILAQKRFLNVKKWISDH